MEPQHKFPYKWYLKDGYPAKGIEAHNKTVFSTFSCGGGSSMGYKLAGYKVIAANDIDNQMRFVYINNHHPKYYILSDVRKLLTKDYPKEFYDLDVLDGSPPCSTFSMAGSREEAWGKEKQFREGQSMQTLDDLFFDFIALAKKLQPKTIIAENVEGLISGNAKGYFLEIVKKFDEAGYTVQSFLLNASYMGVPQKRKRVFLLCQRKDINLPKIQLQFNEDFIRFGQIQEVGFGTKITGKALYLWKNRRSTDTDLAAAHERIYQKRSFFGTKLVKKEDVCFTVIASDGSPIIKYDEARELTDKEYIQVGTFPLDYDFLNIKPKYLIGMSVPPVMMAQVAHQVYKQWLSLL